MRTVCLFYLAGFFACTTSAAGDGKHTVASSGEPHKVLLELFTSQGCSSCPPADKLVNTLAQTDSNLIVLSFHVDYWDRLGWKDVFSNHQYTLRQQQYVHALHAQSLYTPQAVVQGQYEMVGSNKPGITNALAKAGSIVPYIQLSASHNITDKTVSVNYEINRVQPGQQLVAALVQTRATTKIARGENAGIELSGYNIVRQLEVQTLSDKIGTIRLAMPDNLIAAEASIVLFVQNSETMKVLAVTRMPL